MGCGCCQMTSALATSGLSQTSNEPLGDPPKGQPPSLVAPTQGRSIIALALVRFATDAVSLGQCAPS